MKGRVMGEKREEGEEEGRSGREKRREERRRTEARREQRVGGRRRWEGREGGHNTMCSCSSKYLPPPTHLPHLPTPHLALFSFHPPPLPNSTHLHLLVPLLFRNRTLLHLFVMLKNCLLQSCRAANDYLLFTLSMYYEITLCG